MMVHLRSILRKEQKCRRHFSLNRENHCCLVQIRKKGLSLMVSLRKLSISTMAPVQTIAGYMTNMICTKHRSSFAFLMTQRSKDIYQDHLVCSMKQTDLAMK